MHNTGSFFIYPFIFCIICSSFLFPSKLLLTLSNTCFSGNGSAPFRMHTQNRASHELPLT